MSKRQCSSDDTLLLDEPAAKRQRQQNIHGRPSAVKAEFEAIAEQVLAFLSKDTAKIVAEYAATPPVCGRLLVEVEIRAGWFPEVKEVRLMSIHGQTMYPSTTVRLRGNRIDDCYDLEGVGMMIIHRYDSQGKLAARPLVIDSDEEGISEYLANLSNPDNIGDCYDPRLLKILQAIVDQVNCWYAGDDPPDEITVGGPYKYTESQGQITVTDKSSDVVINCWKTHNEYKRPCCSYCWPSIIYQDSCLYRLFGHTRVEVYV
jgi:hypothetical protein